jgi:N-acetylneuraminic acid mutarotase
MGKRANLMQTKISRILLLSILALVMASYTSAQDSQGSWTTAAAMPTARSEAVATVLDGKIYVAGGLNSNGDGMTEFEVYDPATDSWEVLAPLLVGLHHLAITATEEHIYISGGYEDPSFSASVSTLWRYDPAANTWEALTEMPSARAAHTMQALDNLIYVIGGVGPDQQALWAYDLENDAWITNLAPFPAEREHLTSVVLDDKIIVIGGRWRGNLALVESYDPATDTWEQLPEMPVPSSGLTSAIVDGRIHVTGGEELQGSETIDAHQVYDPQANTWTLWEPLPTARHGLASGAVDGKFYVIGGGSQAGGGTYNSLESIVEVFTPAAQS